jgi:hypothetical protein
MMGARLFTMRIIKDFFKKITIYYFKKIRDHFKCTTAETKIVKKIKKFDENSFLTPEYPHALLAVLADWERVSKNLAVGLLAAGCTVRVLVYGQKEDSFLMRYLHSTDKKCKT